MQIFRALVGITFLFTFALGCGPGSDPLAHSGFCGNYPESTASLYKLPYLVGTSHVLSQGNCSGASHYGSSRYAYDFVMPIGTAVYAARGGTVVAAIENNSDGNGCPNANYVMIEHSDASVAVYAHLTLNGALVTAGDTVLQGQQLGSSGSTGCSSGPHLHFEVHATGSSPDSIPVSFSNAGNGSKILVSGTDYLAQ